MKKTQLIFVYVLLGILFSCNNPDNYIIETDIERIAINASKNGLTVEESGRMGALVFDSLKKNTVGKKLPSVIVTNLSNQKLNLANDLSGTSVIISSDIYCGFGLDCISNLFPKALKLLKNKNKDTRIICLLKKTASDVKDSKLFDKTLNELKSSYQAIYIIDESEARKLNLSINPTRLYVNKYNIVTNYELGLLTVEEYYKEIKQNTGASAHAHLIFRCVRAKK